MRLSGWPEGMLHCLCVAGVECQGKKARLGSERLACFTSSSSQLSIPEQGQAVWLLKLFCTACLLAVQLSRAQTICAFEGWQGFTPNNSADWFFFGLLEQSPTLQPRLASYLW